MAQEEQAQARFFRIDMLPNALDGCNTWTLVHEVQSAGYYKMAWDSRNEAGEPVATRVYF